MVYVLGGDLEMTGCAFHNKLEPILRPERVYAAGGWAGDSGPPPYSLPGYRTPLNNAVDVFLAQPRAEGGWQSTTSPPGGSLSALLCDSRSYVFLGKGNFSNTPEPSVRQSTLVGVRHATLNEPLRENFASIDWRKSAILNLVACSIDGMSLHDEARAYQLGGHAGAVTLSATVRSFVVTTLKQLAFASESMREENLEPSREEDRTWDVRTP